MTCRYPHCADYDERCLTGINIPCAPVAPARTRRMERVLLTALAVALLLSVAGLTVRALQISERQAVIERV